MIWLIKVEHEVWFNSFQYAGEFYLIVSGVPVVWQPTSEP